MGEMKSKCCDYFLASIRPPLPSGQRERSVEGTRELALLVRLVFDGEKVLRDARYEVINFFLL